MKGLAITALLLLLSACGSIGVIDADNVKGTIRTLTERVDVYTEFDATLTDAQKLERTTESANFRTYFASGGMVPAVPIAPSAYRVLQTHDAYIEGDEALNSFERRLAMFESSALRGVFDEALRRFETDTP